MVGATFVKGFSLELKGLGGNVERRERKVGFGGWRSKMAENGVFSGKGALK